MGTWKKFCCCCWCSLENMTNSPCFVTQEIPGKGTGVVAVRDIEPGHLIISEEPLFIVPWWVRHSMYPRIFSQLLARGLQADGTGLKYYGLDQSLTGLD